MLSNRIGRVRVPVGVAYGSDVERVKELLMEIALNHENIMNDAARELEPSVLFMGFGDSSLNFELRGFLKNIKDRLGTLSDLNFAINAAFRKEGIQIPFPQRDLHIIPENKNASGEFPPPQTED